MRGAVPPRYCSAVQPYPLLFEPIFKEKVWGGRSLATLGKALPPGALIGESWELADLPETVPGGQSIIANGELAGSSLRAAIRAGGEQIMGAAAPAPGGGFPLLIKYLDACENLSVQVHPDEEYVRHHPEAHLKSEAWIVLRARPGAVIYKGVKAQVGPDEFRRHLETGAVADDLVVFAVEPGQCHYLPSGTCHALGAGIVVAEIQTPSDTTFRVFDWGRRGRDLHIDQALQCIRFGQTPMGPQTPGTPSEVGGLRTTPLLKTELFEIERIEARAGASLEIVTSGMPIVWMVVAGGGNLAPGTPGTAGTPGTPTAPAVELRTGTTVLIPAALCGSKALFARDTALLRVTPRSPLEGLIA